MEIAKTQGVIDEDGIKNFIITDSNGDTYIALRQDSGKFTIGDDGVHRTLKQCKEVIVNDSVMYFADTRKEEKEPGTWDCVDPCALLVLISVGGEVSRDEINRTLDSFGWVKPDGSRDVEQAKECYEKWGK
jgi:hypothetical protein